MLTIHRAERADRLVEALASELVRPPADPFAAEVVAVPTRGVERWLTQRLSAVLGASVGRQDGVCANVEFPFPGRLIGNGPRRGHGCRLRARSVASGAFGLAAHVGCRRAPRRRLDGATGRASRRLGSPEGDETRRTRRFSVVRHLADLFDHYGIHRPGMIGEWAAGDDTDGHGQPLPSELTWQAPLWRCLREHLATPSPAERLRTRCDQLRADPSLVDLPPRLSLFGMTRLPGSFVDVLAAIAFGRHVHMFLLHPSPALWARISEQQPDRAARASRCRQDDPTATLARNPLLATWGRDAREMQLVLGSARSRHPARGQPPRTRRTGRLPPAPPADATSEPTWRHPGHRCPARRMDVRCSMPATTASRSMPATGVPAKWTCSGTPSCISWPTTRRSSRGT